MKIAIVGAGAMGSVFAQFLAPSNDVTLIDVYPPVIDIINSQGLRVDEKDGASHLLHPAATTNAAEVGTVDLIILFVKCYHTESATSSILPLLGPQTAVLTLQNGWGNAAIIQKIVGSEHVLAGVTYHSARVISPGHVQHTASGRTVIGELDGTSSPRLAAISEIFNGAGVMIEPTCQIVAEIWAKLALTVCSLPTSALMRFQASELVRHQGTRELMSALLSEVVAVAKAQGIPIDYQERRSAIFAGLERAGSTRASMLQDIEGQRRTEIDVINGAIMQAGHQLNIPTPYNNALVWMVKALEETFESGS